MSRSRVLLALVAMSLFTVGCSLGSRVISMDSCSRDVDGRPVYGKLEVLVGEPTTLIASAQEFLRTGRWSLDSGSGTLVPLSLRGAEYTAIEPGSAVVSWEGRAGTSGGEFFVYQDLSARCEIIAASPTVDAPVVLECETSRFKVEVGPRPVTAFHNGYIEFDTNVTTVAGMNYDTSEFELSVGGDDELLAGTLGPRVSQPGDTSQSFSWHVTIDRVTGEDLPVGEHRLEVTVTEEAEVGTMSCTLPFTIDIIEYGG